MKPLALHLESTTTFTQVRKLMMRQMHDELTGMMEGEDTQPLYNLETIEPDEKKAEGDNQNEEEWSQAEQEQWIAVLKGKGGKGI